MSATDTLKEDHKQIKRLDKLIVKCYEELYDGKLIRFSDIEKISLIISEFLDSIHYYREEGSYFACVSSYNTLKDEIRTFLIEHEFGRRIAIQIKKHLERWKDGEDAREPVARFLKTYSIYLNDHMSKEEKFFDKAQKEVLSPEEEQEMYEQFNSVVAITTKLDEMIKQIDFLEQQPWYKN
jgi:hemerythrin-like domain-containing protein